MGDLLFQIYFIYMFFLNITIGHMGGLSLQRKQSENVEVKVQPSDTWETFHFKILKLRSIEAK